MKKKIFKLLTGMLLSCALAGSTVAVQAEEAGTDTVKSYLTGEDVSAGVGRRRPIAVMLGNDTNGAPQSGTENAGVIYEAPVEGSITRLMAIIEDYDNIPRIGSVQAAVITSCSMQMSMMPSILIMDRLCMHFSIWTST